MERTQATESTNLKPPIPVDIEHMPVKNDPRMWSTARKHFVLALISSASMIAGFGNSIQSPAVDQMERDLSATSDQFSLSLAVFIIVQGFVPLIWTSISEVKGRKKVYAFSLALCMVGSIVSATSETIQLVIGSRALQAAGLSAVMSIGAATLADIFDPMERGRKMGMYYIAPLFGSAVGPILGGAMTVGFGWRAIFWFMAILSGALSVGFAFFFKDTFRRERSLTYQSVVKQRLRSSSVRSSFVESLATSRKNSGTDIIDVEMQDVLPSSTLVLPDIELSLKDVNPFKPLVFVVRRWNNVAMWTASGLLFGFNYLLLYTLARTLSSKYHYSPLDIGLVSLVYGVGCIAGSLLGGWWSDHTFARLTAANGHVSYPEMRLKAAIYSIFMIPPCSLGFGWVCERHVHVAAICIMLFLCGFFVIWTYASTLGYIADANLGRSSSAFAMNSAARGLSAFIGTEIAVPLQDGLGDGWTYTIWAGLTFISACLLLVVSCQGERWRKQAEDREV